MEEEDKECIFITPERKKQLDSHIATHKGMTRQVFDGLNFEDMCYLWGFYKKIKIINKKVIDKE